MADELSLDGKVIEVLKGYAEEYIYLDDLDERKKIESNVFDFVNSLKGNDAMLRMVYLQTYFRMKSDYGERRQDELNSIQMKLFEDG
jgi:hypothetical protein